MLTLPLEFGEITIDGLVDSGAFINAVSWSDYSPIKMNSDNCIIKEYPQPRFKIECANAQLEQPLATAEIQINIETYKIMDTFVILSKTSFSIIGLNFMQKHHAVIDTANGTINFPHVEMTLAMTKNRKQSYCFLCSFASVQSNFVIPQTFHNLSYHIKKLFSEFYFFLSIPYNKICSKK